MATDCSRWHIIRYFGLSRNVRNTDNRTRVRNSLRIRFCIFVLTGRTITLFPKLSAAGIVTLDYVVKMALDSSLRRGESPGARQNGVDAGETDFTGMPGVRPASAGISVTLWDEITPAEPGAVPPLDDDSPEA